MADGGLDSNSGPVQPITAETHEAGSELRGIPKFVVADALTEQMATMRHQFYIAMKDVILESENRVTAVLQDTRKELQALREEVSGSLETRHKNARRG